MQHHQRRNLNSQDYKTLSLAALGGALEFYDFIIFVFFAKVISDLFFPLDIPEWLRLIQTFGIFAAGYLARPFGGIIMAHFGDLVGRKRMFSLSILMMAVPTLCIGLLPTYEQIGFFAPVLLLIMRVFQGAAVGGEVPGAWVFVSEHVPNNRIGFACGVLTSGLVAGILLGSLVSTVINATLTDVQAVTFGWRIPFFLGGIFGLFAMYLRRWLKETPIFNEMKQAKQLASEMPLKSVLADHRRSVVIAMLLTWVLSAGIVVLILMAPVYLETEFKLSRATSLNVNSIAIIAVGVGCVFYGLLIDRIGAVKTMVFGCAFAAVSALFFYYSLSAYPELMFISYPLAGLGVGVVGSFAYIMVHSFPAAVRFTGISFSFNMAYAVAGGLTPPFVQAMTGYAGQMFPAYYIAVLFTIGIFVGLSLRKGYKVEEKETNSDNIEAQGAEVALVCAK